MKIIHTFIPYEVGEFTIKDGDEIIAKFEVDETSVAPEDWNDIKKYGDKKWGYELNVIVNDFTVEGEHATVLWIYL